MRFEATRTYPGRGLESGVVHPSLSELSYLVAGNVDDPWIDFEDDEKQQERDEIDELFHSGSQKQDVAA